MPRFRMSRARFVEASVRRRVTVKSENGRELRNGVGFREYSLLSRVPPVHASCGGYIQLYVLEMVLTTFELFEQQAEPAIREF
jgi:hypothetical protein